jgi:hypothetical protein
LSRAGLGVSSCHHSDVEERVVLIEWTGVDRLVCGRGRCWIIDGQGLREVILDWRALLDTRGEVSVHSQYVVGNLAIFYFVDVVGYDK